MLASAGTADGTVKLWDLRTHGSYTKKTPCPPLPCEESLDPTFARKQSLFSATSSGKTLGVGRSYGISSMVLSPEGDVIYALGVDNQCVYLFAHCCPQHSLTKKPLSFAFRVHCHSLTNLSHALPQTYSHPSLQVSFYSKLALSPDGRYLASGSVQGDVHLWEVGGSFASPACGEKERNGIALEFQIEGGKKKEVGSVSWGTTGVSPYPHSRLPC